MPSMPSTDGLDLIQVGEVCRNEPLVGGKVRRRAMSLSRSSG